MPITIVFVRHGETDHNAEGIIQGQGGPGLNARGLEQARRVADRLSRERFDALYASDIERAHATAEIIAERIGLGIRPAPAMRERDFGRLCSLRWQEIRDRYPEAWEAWRRDVANFCPPGGESTYQLGARAAAFVEELCAAHEGQRVLVVGHGGPIKAAICHAIGVPLSRKRSLVIENGSISVIRRAHEWRLMCLNETWHLDGAGLP